jgi:hypothetical protein
MEQRAVSAGSERYVHNYQGVVSDAEHTVYE